MPVTFPIAKHPPKVYRYGEWGRGPESSAEDILSHLPTTHAPREVLQSSFDQKRQVIVTRNGFVSSIAAAYVNHHNLVIRPDDVWIAILTQLNFYINAHAEELRSKFVNHQGQKTLEVKTSTPIKCADFADLSSQMIGQIHQNVKDKSLIPWILPNFSTTTVNDTVTCSVVIMSTLKQYFGYRMVGGCGIPFLTLDGTRRDWMSIVERLDKLSEFGREPERWARMLRVVLSRFVNAFGENGLNGDYHFWEKMVHKEGGNCTPSRLTGWISVFCAWDTKGNFRLKESITPPQRAGNSDGWTFLDGFWFPPLYTASEGYVEVDVTLVDTSVPFMTKEYDCTMLAGHVGFHMDGRTRWEINTVHIAPHWFMYLKGEKQYHFRGFWLPEE